jgi:orotate phosphoribosyltransferase
LAVVAQYKWARGQKGFDKGSHVLLMGRGAAKGHGAKKDQIFLGEPKGRVVVVEDVTTTGGSLIEAINSLKENDVNVVAAVGLTNRLQRDDDGRSVEQAVGELGIPYHAMSTARDVLPVVADRLNVSPEVRSFITKEFEEFGTEPIAL